MRVILAALILTSVTAACVSADKERPGADSFSLAVAGRPAAPAPTGGYFVALAGAGPTDKVALFDGLYDAIDRYNRKQAEEAGRLGAYLEEFEADGYTRLADDDSEIECDRTKCLVKLAARTIAAKPGAKDALAAQLTQALVLKGLTPQVRGTGETQRRAYSLGKKPGLYVGCEQKGVGAHAAYSCEFDLSKSDPPVATQARGKLVSCALAPGTVRNAQEAKDEVEGGALLDLAAPAGGKPVGYLRFARAGGRVEFLDLYLCGDLSHDHLAIEGAARSPSAWLPKPVKVGASVPQLDTVHQDDARLAATATVLSETAAGYTVAVKFKLDRESDAAGEVYGDDEFVLKVDKSWVN